MVDPADPTRRRTVQANAAHEGLLVAVVRQGQVVYRSPALGQIRERPREQLAALHPGIKRFLTPHEYPAALEKGLRDLKTRLVMRSRKAMVCHRGCCLGYEGSQVLYSQEVTSSSARRMWAVAAMATSFHLT
jgi:hypothetical protein